MSIKSFSFLLLLINNLLLKLFKLLSDRGVVDCGGGDVIPFCIIVDVAEGDFNDGIVCDIEFVVPVPDSCSFNVLTSFSANVAL